MLAIADDTTSVSLQRAYEIYARNSGWVAGTDYTIDYQVTTADGTPWSGWRRTENVAPEKLAPKNKQAEASRFCLPIFNYLLLRPLPRFPAI